MNKRRGKIVAGVLLCGAVGVGCRSGKVSESLDFYSYGMASQIGAWSELVGEGAAPLPFRPDASTEAGVRVYRLPPEELPDGSVGLAHLARRLGSSLEELGERRVQILSLAMNRSHPRARVRLEVSGLCGSEPAQARAEIEATFRSTPAGYVVETARMRSAELVMAGSRRFVERAEELGLTLPHTQGGDEGFRTVALPGVHAPPGCAVADLTGDGYPEIVIADGGRDRIYVNQRGTGFSERGREMGVLPGGQGRGVLVFDVESDRDLDLLVVNGDRDPHLYLNQGGGRFVERGSELGVTGVLEGTAAAAADVDLDGDLDLFIVCYGDPQREWPSLTGRNGEPDRLFLWEGGAYREAAEEAGVDEPGWGLAAAFSDYDGDGAPDLYIANDFGRNALLHNNRLRGELDFDDVTLRTATLDHGFGMSVAWGDYDEDLDQDLYVGNYYWEGRYVFDHPQFPMPPFPAPILRRPITRRMSSMTRGNSLFENQTYLFRWRSRALGVDDAGWAWGSGFLDWDNDGDLDLISVNGWLSGPDPTEVVLPFWTNMVTDYEHMEGGSDYVDIGNRSLHGYEANRLFVNRTRETGTSRFVEAGPAGGFDSRRDGRGVAWGDLDRDGDLDVVVGNHLQPPSLLINEGPLDPGWIQLELDGPLGGIGARVIARTQTRTLVRHLGCGEGFLSTSEPILHIGLGHEHAPVTLDIRWPDGTWTHHPEVVPGHRYRVRQGQSEMVLDEPESDA